MKCADLCGKVIGMRHVVGGQVPKDILARNCMECPDLHIETTFPYPVPWDQG